MVGNYDVKVVDYNPSVILAYTAELGGLKWGFNIGDILAQEGDAIVSPANSFGFMDGGVDLDYTAYFGEELEARVKGFIKADFGGEMEVGHAIIVPTYHEKHPYLVVAPTMRTPKIIKDPMDIYKAAKAIFSSVDEFNINAQEEGLRPINSLLMPGLGTGTGLLDPKVSAQYIRQAYIDLIREQTPE